MIANRLFSQAYLCQYFFDKSHKKGRLKVISDDLNILLGLDPTYGLKMVLKRLVTFKYIKY